MFDHAEAAFAFIAVSGPIGLTGRTLQHDGLAAVASTRLDFSPLPPDVRTQRGKRIHRPRHPAVRSARHDCSNETSCPFYLAVQWCIAPSFPCLACSTRIRLAVT